jgi:hypothetical protein
MPDDSNALPLGRLLRWTVIATLILFGLVLYFRTGLRLSPLTGFSSAESVDSGR